jgi:ACS family hexuronate transporter-like MFS transporter
VSAGEPLPVVAAIAAVDEGPRMTNVRWVVCALLFFATTINYIDRQILALIKEFLDQELLWTNEQFGLVNSAFQGAYAVGLLGFGWLVDRYGTKFGYALSITMWSVAAMGHALVGSIGGFFGARVALGVSEGGNFPSAIKAVALWFPRRERAFATAIFNSGANVGAIIAPAAIPAIAYTLGWRWAFLFAGIAGLLWLLFWIPLYDLPERRKRVGSAELALIGSDRDDEGPAGRPMGWIRSLRHRQTWSFIVAKFMTDPVWWFFLIWLPDYFKATRGLNIKKSWVHLVTIYTIVTVLSIAGGWVTGYLTRRGWSVTRARKTGMFVFALLVLPILAATRVGDWPAVLLIGLAASAHQAWSANLYTTVSDMFAKKDLATIIGLGGMAGSVGGILFPWISGRVLDHYHALGNVTAGYTILFAICASAYLVAFGIHHLLAPRFERIAVAG